MFIALPWPPSVNHYWRSAVRNGRLFVYISPEGRRYRETVAALARAAKIQAKGPVRICLRLYPPDRRRRDADNLRKALYDALVACGALEDDSMAFIVEEHCYVCDARKPGTVTVEIANAEDKRTDP